MDWKQKVVMTAIAVSSTVQSFGQDIFKRYMESKKDVTTYLQNRTTPESDNKKTANYTDYTNQSGESNTVEVAQVNGEHVYCAGLAASDFGLGYDNISHKKTIETKSGDNIYVYASPKGIACVYGKGNGFGATLNDSGSVDYFSINNGKKTPVQEKSTINTLNELNERYGTVAFPQEIANKIDKAGQRIAKAQERQSGEKHVVNENISYTTYNNNIKVSGNVGGSVSFLMPEIRYNNKTHKYTCGPSQNFNESDLRQIVDMELRTILAENYVYKDLQKRENQGENLNQAEQTFKNKHIEKLGKWGISMVDGKLKQQNPQYTQQSMQNSHVNGGIGS